MKELVWFFMIYSLIGFLLEVAFACAVRASNKNRKCFFLLPLCPVYGIGAVSILLLPDTVKQNPLLLMVLGAAAATAAEYVMGLFYEKAVGVKFWDYSHLPGNLGGKVCLLFTGFWSILSLVLIYITHPVVSALVKHIPDILLLPVLFLLALDGTYTILLLRRTADAGALKWYQNFSLRLLRHEP